MTDGPTRHDLLAVEPSGWTAVAATRASRPPLPAEAAALVGRWGAVGWPVIARRAAGGDPADAVPVGLPLPPRFGKARVALAVPHGVAWRPVPRPALAELRAAPEPWRVTIDAVLSLGAALDLAPGVFGALLWHRLTGLAYLHPGSDLDLLWTVADPAAVPPLLDGLARLDAEGPVRIDGEVRTPHGDVNWRELAAARRGEAPVVLVKTAAQAGFATVADLFAPEALPCS